MPQLDALEAHLAALIAQTAPAARRTLARELARRLRESQRRRVAAQLNPDGTPFEPRKARASKRRRKPEIRRRMFARLMTARYLKAQSSADWASVAFTEAASRIAQVHQFGLRDRVARRRTAPEVKYPERQLLGATQADTDLIAALLLDHLEK